MKKLDKKDGKIWDAQGKDLGRVKNFPFIFELFF